MDFAVGRKYNRKKFRKEEGVGDMEIYELTEKIESLSAEDYEMVIMLVNRLSDKSEAVGLERFSEEKIVEQLTKSMEKSNRGETKSAREVSKKMREKYAI
jgi:hypothetical protein